MNWRPTDHRGRDIQKEIESAIGAPFDCHLLAAPSAVNDRGQQWQVRTDLYEDDEPRCSYSVLACQRCGQAYLSSHLRVYKDDWWVLSPISEEEGAEALALAETIPPHFDPYNTALRFARMVTKNRPYIIHARMSGLAEGQKTSTKSPAGKTQRAA